MDAALLDSVQMAQKGFAHGACPDNWEDCDAARAIVEALRLDEDDSLVMEIHNTLRAAERDISEWIQLAIRLQDELPKVGLIGPCPTDGGIARSEQVKQSIVNTMIALRKVFGDAVYEKESRNA